MGKNLRFLSISRFSRLILFLCLVMMLSVNIGVAQTFSSITVTPSTVNVDAGEHEGTLAISYNNLNISGMNDFAIQFYGEDGGEIPAQPDWVDIVVAEEDPTVGEGYVVSYFMLENEGETHTAYFKLYAIGNGAFVYSNLITITQAGASGTLDTLPTPDECYTVANSTTNATSSSFSPIYGNYCDHQQRTQSIYPASMLTELIGKTITHMKYYVSAGQNYNWRNKVFTVKLATVNEENIDTSFVYLDNYTTVYTGTLYAAMDTGMVITFNGTAPFTYQGGNLLVEFESTSERDNYQACWFAGIYRAHGSICEYGYSNYPSTTIVINDFLPKVDFCTEPSPCPAVRGLAVSDITGNSAHVSWMPGSSETMWQYICSETELSNQALQNYNWYTSFDLYVDLSNLNVNTTYHVYVRPEIRGNSYCSDEIRHTSFTTIPTCLPPTNVTISNVTSSTATVSWEYVNGFVPESGWIMHLSTTPQFGSNDIYRAIAGGNDMESPFTIRELQAGTTYYLKMQSNCRTQQHFNDFSTWTEEYSFTTACDAIVVDAEHSFTENFDTTAFPPTNCWSRINSNTHAWSRVGASDYNHSGAVNGSAYSSFWGDVYLVLPDIALANDANDVSLSFWSKNSERLSYTVNNNSVVLLDGNSETVLWSPSFVRGEWAETTINLNQYKGQTIRLAFKHTGNTANPESPVNGWYLDDITIAETTPTDCPDVTNLNAELLGNGSDSVKISWASLDTNFVMQHEIFLSTVYRPDQESIDSLSNFTNPLQGTSRGTIRNYYVYGNLEPNTQYYAYVRRWCTFDNGASVDFGNWSAVPFTTQANKYNITLNQVTGGTITINVVDNLGNAFSATTDTAAAYNAWVNLSVETDAGYTFGNYVVTTASGIPIEIINSGFVMPAEDVTISANFGSEKHILTINYIYSTSGNNIYPCYKDTLEYGESYSVVSPPENDGFYPSIDTVSGVMGAEDITISVSYLPRVYQVTLHPRGGMLLNGFTSDTSYTRAQVFWLPTANDIVREGYSFGGWFRDTLFLGNPFRAIPNVSTGDWDLYAKWDIN
ncbi:MAG: choice-of-anchor J domain-containing protein, partial [Bacteroidales bacterium]|nr:choice-of-anchor J domain-containing protein [Bacteroidales bacterium]